MTLIDIPYIYIALLTFWGLILIVLALDILISFIRNKHLLYSLISGLVLVVEAFFYFGVTPIISGNNENILELFKDMPYIVYLVINIVSTIIIIIMFVLLYMWDKNNLSAFSLQQAYDKSDEGILYFDDNGLCLLINKKMHEIGWLILGEQISNGFDFYNKVNNKTITLNDGRIFKFVSYESIIKDINTIFSKEKNRHVYQLIGYDVTELEKKNEELRVDNKRLEIQNKALKEYNQNMQHIIHDNEILSAKIQIHDEMNSLILKTSYLIDNDNETERINILNKWKSNIILLLKEASEENDDIEIINDLETLGKAFGIKVTINNLELIKNEKISKLFIKKSKECLINVAKHSNAKELKINVTKENDNFILEFINSNNKNKKEIIFGGGLKEIQRQVEELHGKISVNNEDNFIVKVEVSDAI